MPNYLPSAKLFTFLSSVLSLLLVQLPLERNLGTILNKITTKYKHEKHILL